MNKAGASKTGVVASPDGVPIAYEVHGTGKPALVLIHGWACDKSYWATQSEALSGDFQIIILDLGGHGDSGTGRESWTIDSFGKDVAAVVEAINPAQVVLIGHSMGGHVAVAAARLLGERVKAVVAVDIYRKLGPSRSPEEIQTVLAPFRASFKETTNSYVHRLFANGTDAGLARRVAVEMSAAPPLIAIPALESSLTFERTITETLKQIDAPIIAINASEPPHDVESLQRHGVNVVTMSGVGHFLMMEAAQRFNDLLKQIVSEMP